MNNENPSNNLENFEEQAGEFMSASDAMSGTNYLPEDEFENESDDDTSENEKALKEANDKYLRLAAEFDNYRKRMIKEKIDLQKTASQELATPLLEVLDDMDRAKEQLEKSEDITSLKEGLDLVFNKLKSILKSKGLEEVDSLGKLFDTDFHEAVTEIPVDNEEQKGKVVDQVSKGYTLNDKIIRHAKVIVGK